MEHRMGASGVIQVLSPGIDTQMTVESGQHILWRFGIGGGQVGR
jgi:hypothetical protein